MSQPVPSGSGALLVALGAVPGAWLRFLMVNHLAPVLPRQHWRTLLVNLLACFLLGVVVALAHSHRPQSGPLSLLVATGFLGSFSTFSTFSAELLTVLQQRQWGEALLLGAGSVLGGLLAVQAGLALAPGR